MAILRKKSVDEVIAVFEKARADLVALADELTGKSAAKRAQAAAIAAEADDHQAEAERAKRVADRVRALTA